MAENFPKPFKTEIFDISAVDHTFTLKVDGVWFNVGGTVIVKFRGDSTNRTAVVAASSYLMGDIETIVKSGTDAGFTAATAGWGFRQNAQN